MHGTSFVPSQITNDAWNFICTITNDAWNFICTITKEYMPPLKEKNDRL
jgi:hypothetical protein